MLNRRLLRIKVFQALYSYQLDEARDLKSVEKYLEKSLKNVEDEYVLLLSLPIEIRYYVENEQNPEEILYVPSKQDIETGKTFIYNKLINKLDQNDELKRKLKSSGHNWYQNKDVMRMLFNGFKTSNYFVKYLGNEDRGYEAQRKLMLQFFKDYLPKQEELDIHMEELFIHWNDDKKAIFNSLSKTLEDIKGEDDNLSLKPLSEDYAEDWKFCRSLLHYTIEQQDYVTGLITEKTKKWDADRIAEVDLILMRMALVELLNFVNIPVKVTINEYLELAKIYSTPKSSVFLNGVLDKIMNELKQEGKIKKVGRGLVE